ncbi:proline-rich receptor-like protein kinase PERK8 [Iris pallida]|uniref:Proline-rich receptor-like protein kinase PERK8 n=1 Tax=Iris pallida TaxID=29817 RepID=A0AAX6ELZ1_IRIPA|nr:proline-rich receptor-like protein kinase PERK8 [Iris pallida]
MVFRCWRQSWGQAKMHAMKNGKRWSWTAITGVQPARRRMRWRSSDKGYLEREREAEERESEWIFL